MIPQPDRSKARSANGKGNIGDRLSLHLPYEITPDLAAVVDAWSSLPEAIRAGILAMVKASGKRGSR
jgi:hypothetical protein